MDPLQRPSIDGEMMPVAEAQLYPNRASESTVRQLIDDGIPEDPALEKATQVWNEWVDKNWYLYHKQFIRDSTIKRLELHAAEGPLDIEQEKYVGLAALVPVLNYYRENTEGDRLRDADLKKILAEAYKRLGR